MSQRSVEQFIGRLATDEGFRRRFTENPQAVLEEASASGADLTAAERKALLATDLEGLTRFADAIDPRIQKCDLGGRDCGN